MTRTISLPCRIAGALCIAQLALAAPTGAQVLLGQAAPEGDVDNPVEAQLVADTTAMRPGTTFTLGVLLKLQPEWHVYWTNPGEVGYATTFEWTLPDKAMKAGPVQYPYPERFISPGPLNSFGYSNEVLLMSEVAWEATGAADTAAELEFGARGRWLMCSDRCIPGKAEITLKLPVGKPEPANQALFARYRGLLPKPGAGGGMLKAKSVTGEDGTSVTMTVTPPPGRQIVAADKLPALRGAFFFPERVKGFDVTTPVVSPADATVAGDIPVYTKPFTIEWRLLPEKRAEQVPAELAGVLVMQAIGADGKAAPPVAELVKINP